jgi:Family of unknown function (DUF6527)
MASGLAHQFVDSTPSELEDGIIYVSMRFRVAVHLCACGRKNKVVTPLRPAKWKLIFDGDTVSLSPSIGNWQFPCRSHYWIDRDQIKWAKSWSDDEIASGRARDARESHRYYADKGKISPPDVPASADVNSRESALVRGWKRLRRTR